MKIIILEKQVEESVSDKQLKYIQDLMIRKKLYSLYLDNLGFDTRNRLSKKSAGKLIECLVSGQDFKFQEELI
jgi:hypothetical protein